jgi:hypothetical protein
MEYNLALEKADVYYGFIKSRFREKLPPREISRTKSGIDNLSSNIREDFFQYLQFLQLENEPNLLSLSSTHNYYFDSNDLKNIRTIINLKELNNIKSLGSFLQTIARILPLKANFIGYFKNDTGNRSVFSFYQSTKFFNGLVNYFDCRTDRSLTKKEVSGLLEGHYLKVVDISDMNGMTYFCSQNIICSKS